MKKVYILAGILIAFSAAKAQTTVDLEEFNLSPESFYNGSDQAGGFTSEGVTFKNTYNSEWDSWSGFSYSNITDNTTADYSNQYSAIPGSGADNSEIYAVYYDGDTLQMPSTDNSLHSVAITNTSYAYYSMKDGNAFSKKFGSLNDAEGNDDETNGEDFFYITIYAHDQNDVKVDSIDFYLADFRFSDPNDDYILNEWTTLDLSAFTSVNYLTFEFHSSDVGIYGINTPTYFALDNFKYDETVSTEKLALSDVEIYPNPAFETLSIKGVNENMEICDLKGKVIKQIEKSSLNAIDISDIKPGIYLVRSSNSQRVMSQKLIIQ